MALEHTEKRGGPTVPSPYSVVKVDFQRCGCGATLTSDCKMCDQCSRRLAFTALGNNVVNQSGGAS